MAQLDDDIARVAALRGKTSAEYVAAQAERQRLTAAGGFITQTQFWDLFLGQPDGKTDLKVFDQLPAASRHFIAEFPFNICSAKWAGLLVGGVDEAALIGLVESNRRVLAKAWLKGHYGAGHPVLRGDHEDHRG